MRETARTMTTGTFLKQAVGTLLVGTGLALLGVLFGPAAPATAAPVSLDLYTRVGTANLPGNPSLPVWGYGTTAGTTERPGGPTLTVHQGDTVTITLHNSLTEATGLLLQGQQMVPDRTGASAGATKSYSFTAARPGTYLYEAALLPNAQHQVAMGLYGALVVLPAAAGQAYDDPSTSFDKDQVLVLSEIDPALNNAANKATFDMRNFAPRYSLLNGTAHPATAPITTVGGDKVLLRYVNAGTTYHSMGVLGAHQSVIALDGSLLSAGRPYVAETFGPGQTADALVTAPTTRTPRKVPVYDAGLLLHNSNAASGGFGGMLTWLQVAADQAAGGDTTGPVTGAVGYANGRLTATVDDGSRGGANLTAVEYFLDVLGAEGSGTSIPVPTTPSARFDLDVALSVPSGEHIVYVRGKDAGTWGPLSSVLVDGGDAGGPTTRSPLLTPGLTNGSTAVAVSATGDDSASGGSNIQAAEYTLDGGPAVAMAVNAAAPVASLDGTIPAGVVAGLREGSYVVAIRSQDAQGNWGDPATLTLDVDKAGPTATSLSAAPTPNNGTLPFNASTPAVRVMATLTDPPSATGLGNPVSKAELFLDTVGADGAGIGMKASDGVFNAASEGGYADIPLATVRAMSNGNHTLHVHARDAAGNWGPIATTTLLVDKTGPSVTGVAATPNPTQGAGPVTLTGSATDTLSAVTAAEWFVGADPGAGNATPMTRTGSGLGPVALSAGVDVRDWSEGTYTLRVRAKDAAGNWGATTSTVLAVTGPLFFSTLGNTNPPGVTGTADDADIYSWSGSAFARAIVVTAAPYNLPLSANVDGYSRVDATHFFLSFSGATTAVPGLGNVQDEDVVYYDNGVWSVYFDGTAHGLGTTGNLDLDAIDVVGAAGGTGGTLYFSTLGNTNPPTVAGTADDADVYSWNGTSYARVWDATANGLAAAANVDGLVRGADNLHWRLSFSPDTTTVPGLGAVQDEDVVFDDAGVWSVYFDGTAKGLTSANLDLDAFDLP